MQTSQDWFTQNAPKTPPPPPAGPQPLTDEDYRSLAQLNTSIDPGERAKAAQVIKTLTPDEMQRAFSIQQQFASQARGGAPEQLHRPDNPDVSLALTGMGIRGGVTLAQFLRDVFSTQGAKAAGMEALKVGRDVAASVAAGKAARYASDQLDLPPEVGTIAQDVVGFGVPAISVTRGVKKVVQAGRTAYQDIKAARAAGIADAEANAARVPSEMGQASQPAYAAPAAPQPQPTPQVTTAPPNVPVDRPVPPSRDSLGAAASRSGSVASASPAASEAPPTVRHAAPLETTPATPRPGIAKAKTANSPRAPRTPQNATLTRADLTPEELQQLDHYVAQGQPEATVLEHIQAFRQGTHPAQVAAQTPPVAAPGPQTKAQRAQQAKRQSAAAPATQPNPDQPTGGLTGVEAVEYQRFRKAGKTHEQALDLIQQQRDAAGRWGLQTPDEVTATLEDRNTTGKWPPMTRAGGKVPTKKSGRGGGSQ